MNTENKNKTKRLVYAALCLALCFLLPFITAQIPEIGKKLCPMHIPVLLCGFLCSWEYGLAVGLVAPITRSLLFGMPNLYPDAIGMTFELAVYGLVSGILYRIFPKKIGYYYLNLAISIICGKIVWGIARFVMAFAGNTQFPITAFFTYGFINSLPGIILQFILIPPVVMLLSRTGKKE